MNRRDRQKLDYLKRHSEDLDGEELDRLEELLEEAKKNGKQEKPNEQQ